MCRSKAQEQARTGTASMQTLSRPPSHASLHGKCSVKMPDVIEN